MLTAQPWCSDPALPLRCGQGCGLPGPGGRPAGSGRLFRIGQARPAHAPDEPPAPLLLEVSLPEFSDSRPLKEGRAVAIANYLHHPLDPTNVTAYMSDG